MSSYDTGAMFDKETRSDNLDKGAERPQMPMPEPKKSWPLLLAVGIIALAVVFVVLFFQLQHRHSFVAATCTAPRICEDCGETRGAALGHLWTDLTCLAPKSCQRCGETKGAASGHQWKEATCETPKICQACGEKQGTALNHQWKEATYYVPKTCAVCGATQGEPLLAETATGIVGVKVGGWATYALTNQGRVYAIGGNQYGQIDVPQWTDIIDVAAGDGHVALLHKDGTVSTVGHWQNGQSEVSSWRNIVDVEASSYCTIGIRKNGTVVLVGENQKVTFDVSGWTDIVQVAATDYFIVGLRADGTVVYTGGNGHEGQASYYENAYKYSPTGKANEIASWRNIVQIAAGRYHTLGLRADGTVVASTAAANEFPAACNVSGWTDIVAVCAGSSFSVGLRRDGTVVVAGDFCDKDRINIWKGNINTPLTWRNVVQISAFYNQIIGLTEEGYVVACGFNSSGLCNVNDLYTKIFANSN